MQVKKITVPFSKTIFTHAISPQNIEVNDVDSITELG